MKRSWPLWSAVFSTPLPWGQSIVFLERLGKMQLIWITALIGYVFNWLVCEFQQFCSISEALLYQKFLRGGAGKFFESSAEIIAV